MSAYTKGPWIIDPVRPGDKEIFISQPGDSWERLEATVSRDDCDSDMAMANARLIAAAPDLLEALKKLLATLPQDVLIDSEDEANAAWAQAQAAIAKAEGQ